VENNYHRLSSRAAAKYKEEYGMGQWTKWTWGLIAAMPFAAQAQVDLASLDRDMAGPRAQILVLGTVHLREMPAGLNPASLDGVLNRLAAFKPDIITVEFQSGEECDLFARHPAKHGEPYNCSSTAAPREATGLDVPAAIAEVDKMLKAWPAQPTAAQRRRVAALFLAASDSASAYAQWLQLPEAERRAGDSLSAALVEMLGKIATSKEESYQLAARLAARLGLPRVHAIDNHTGDNVDVSDAKAFGQSLKAAWTGTGEFAERQKQEAILSQAPDMLPLYRYVNEPEGLRRLAEANVSAAMRAKSPESYPQMWVAGWEIRNLRMIANIRETFRERPGARVLSIVGKSHKPWFDAWLGQLQGVDIVDVGAVLK
jgi:hypothetical protein